MTGTEGNVLGALILYDIENDSGSYNFLILQNYYAHLYARAMLVKRNKADFRLGRDLAQAISTETVQQSEVVGQKNRR